MEEAKRAIERFLNASREPVLLEPGEEPIAIGGDTFLVETRNGRLLIQAWNERANLVRKVLRVEQERPGALELAVERFGKREGRVSLVDMARSNRTQVQRQGSRRAFSAEFRRALRRQFPGWTLAELSVELNLEASLSDVYPRALLRKGAAAWAAMAAPPGQSSGVLTYALIWLDYLRCRERRLTVQGLALFLPQGEERTTCLRLAWLNPRAAEQAVFVYTPEGFEEPVDPANFGNLETRMETHHATPPDREPHIAEWLDRLARCPDLERVERPDGATSLRVRGLEIVRATAHEMRFGIDQRARARETTLGEIERLAADVALRRRPNAEDRADPLYARSPEGWLESQVRRRISELDPSLLSEPVYGQVPAFAGGERGVMDLLAADRRGRLAVLELKASEDVHLPLQALDYWMRVKWHAERGEFGARGYFPGIALLREAPRLLLVAPALDFHPTTETILRYLAPEIEIERIGVGVEWRKRPEIMFRMKGAQRPT